jgi:hypothetical protein
LHIWTNFFAVKTPASFKSCKPFVFHLYEVRQKNCTRFERKFRLPPVVRVFTLGGPNEIFFQSVYHFLLHPVSKFWYCTTPIKF